MLFCNIDFNIKDKQELFLRTDNQVKCIITANAQLIWLANTIERYLAFMNENFVCFDGVHPLKQARKKNPVFNEFTKLSGSDIVYDFCAYANKNNLRVFFLGGKEDANKAAVENIRIKYGVEICGYSPEFQPYPFSQKFVNDCYQRLIAFKPDILFVGFGAPKQEFFIQDSKAFFNEIGIKYVIGCGGTFDFVSGNIRRAPSYISSMGLESIYRLIQEPNLMRLKRFFQSFRFYKYINSEPDFVLK